MMDREPILSEILPQGFDFYHFGKVSLDQEIRSEHENLHELINLEDHVCASFHIYGEAEWIMLFFFPIGLDPSMYLEVGNIIASKFCGRLSQTLQIDTLVSEPRLLKIEQIRELLKRSTASITQKTYLHALETHVIPLKTVFIPIQKNSVEVGNV